MIFFFAKELGSERGLGQLLDEQWHTIGLLDDVLDHFRGQRLTRGLQPDERLHLGTFHAIERNRRHVGMH